MVHQLCKASKVSRNLRPSQSLLILVQYYVSVSGTLAPLRFHSSLLLSLFCFDDYHCTCIRVLCILTFLLKVHDYIYLFLCISTRYCVLYTIQSTYFRVFSLFTEYTFSCTILLTNKYRGGSKI